MAQVEIDNKVKSIVSNIRNLPTPPIVFHQIQKVISDPNVSAAKVASILSEDPAMSVKVLRLTNSAFYGLSKEVDSVKQAVVIVGFEAIKNLVLSASVLDMFKGQNINQEYQEKYWRHSLSVAICCRILSRKLKNKGVVDPDAAFSAGLLHDVGKMVFSCFLPGEYKAFCDQREVDRQRSDFEIEQELFGFTHASIGGFLGEMWKIPHNLTYAIIHHHQPHLQDQNEPLPYIVYLANYIAKKTFFDATEYYLVGGLEPQVAEFMEVTEEDCDSFADLLREEYAKSETFMQLVGI